MRAQIAYRLNRLRTSLWFLPIIGVLSAIFLSWTTITLDRMGAGNWLRDQFGLYAIDPTGARLILSTIAGSMMTIASLVFSMTVLTLTVASQQMGPRLLEWFMSDRVNQSLMSYFVSLFVFALLGIGSIGEKPEEPFERHSAYLVVIVSIVLTVFGIVGLIIFVHRTATSIQTDSAIARTAERLYHGIRNHLTIDRDGRPRKSMPAATARQHNIKCTVSGYVQTVDEKALVSLAKRSGGVLRLCCAPGQYLLHGSVLAEFEGALCSEQLAGEICMHVVTGPQRTSTQDVIFNLRGVVEIALRALSPGINDPFTAVACIDHLTSALAVIMQRKLRDNVWSDEEGVPRLRTIEPSFGDIIDAAFDEIRTFGRDHAAVLRHQLKALGVLAEFLVDAEHREKLSRHLERTKHAVNSSAIHPHITDDLLELTKNIELKLKK